MDCILSSLHWIPGGNVSVLERPLSDPKPSLGQSRLTAEAGDIGSFGRFEGVPPEFRKKQGRSAPVLAWRGD